LFFEKDTNIQTLHNRVSCGSARVTTKIGIIRKVRIFELFFGK